MADVICGQPLTYIKDDVTGDNDDDFNVYFSAPLPRLGNVCGTTSAESIQTSVLQVNYDFDEEEDDYDYDNLWPGSKIRLAKLMGCWDDNAFADKKLNCEYSGPPKAATEDQLQILQQICPHLVEEVTLNDNFEITQKNQIL